MHDKQGNQYVHPAITEEISEAMESRGIDG